MTSNSTLNKQTTTQFLRQESMQQSLRIVNQDKDPFDDDNDHDSGLMVQEARPKVAEPKRYKVILVNDDFTPMEFVVHILTVYFNLNEEKATRVMLAVHTKGKGICGVFSKDVAETKVVQVNEFARENQHPLLCTMEEE